MTRNNAATSSPGGNDAALSEEDVLELLPFYASGKTSPAETRAIEQKLASDPLLQAELKMIRQEKQVSVESVKALGEPAPELLQQMLGQLDGVRQLPPISENPGAARPGFLARLFGVTPTPALRFALAAACVVIVAESAALLSLSDGDEAGSFQTASAPAATGPELIVRFQPDAQISAVTMLITDIGGSVVRGPMPDGAYVIGLPQGMDVAATITILRGHADLVAGVDQGS
jgi:anti-sigma factor RsiW